MVYEFDYVLHYAITRRSNRYIIIIMHTHTQTSMARKSLVYKHAIMSNLPVPPVISRSPNKLSRSPDADLFNSVFMFCVTVGWPSPNKSKILTL